MAKRTRTAKLGRTKAARPRKGRSRRPGGHPNRADTAQERGRRLLAALDHEHLVEVSLPWDNPLGAMPKTAKYLGDVEWSWSPAHSRSDSLHLSTERSRARWILWVVWYGQPRIELRVASCPRKKIEADEAAWALVTAFYRREAEETGLDRYSLHFGGDYLDEEDLWMIANDVWGTPPEETEPVNPAAGSRGT